MTARRETRRLGAAACVAAAAIAAALPLSAPGAPAPPSETAAKPVGEGGKGKKESRAERRKRLRKLARANRRQKRPNVIVITTDDQDDSMLGLPNTVRLIGGSGTTFTNSYASFPLCCPSRATFLTGQHAHNHGVTSTELPNGYGAMDNTNTLAVWLRRAGYRTAMVGKYLNGYGIDDGIPERVSDAKEVPQGWRDWFALTADSDQRRYRYKINEDGRILKFRSRAKDYVTDVLSARAVKVVNEYAPRPKPFFLWFNPTAPHGEAGRPFGATRNPQPAPRHLGAFEGAIRPRTPNFNEADVSDKSTLVSTLPALSDAEILDIDLRYRGRLESLLSVDEGIKRMFSRLRKARDLAKTYVFFTSDNGLLMGAHRLVLKNYLYEEDTRVPLLVRGPKFPEGAVRTQPVSNVDLAPTIVEITGATQSRLMDGQSLLGPANNTSVGVGRDMLFEQTGGDRAIRSGKWIYIDRVGDVDELYDMDNDPFQIQNVADRPSSSAVLSQLRARLAQLRVCAGSSCP